MPWKDVNHMALLKGKGYEPDYKTKDKDLIIPIRVHHEEDPWPHLEEGCSELVELLEVPEEPDRSLRKKGMPRAHGKAWEDENLPPAPEGWRPR